MKIINFLVIMLFLLSAPLFAGEGHDAGYEWAQEHDITDTDYSDGNSDSFNEGVREYAEEQLEALEEDEDEEF